MLKFEDLKVLIYYWGDYILCAPRITYLYQPIDNDLYKIQPAELLYIIRLSDDKLFNESKKYITTPSIRRIASSDGENLLLTIRHEDSFFEVECSSIENNSGTYSIYPTKAIFHSHIFHEEEMKEYVSKALDKISVGVFFPEPNMVISIEKALTDDEIYESINSDSLPRATSDYKLYYSLDLPDWSTDFSEQQLHCSITCTGKKVTFEFRKEDFPIYNIRSDRDGGWFYNTKKETIIGTKIFRTIFEVQKYLKTISEIASPNYRFCGGDSFMLCKYPFQYSAYIYINMNVKVFFSLVNVTHYKTQVEEWRENVGLTDLPE